MSNECNNMLDPDPGFACTSAPNKDFEVAFDSNNDNDGESNDVENFEHLDKAPGNIEEAEKEYLNFLNEEDAKERAKHKIKFFFLFHVLPIWSGIIGKLKGIKGLPKESEEVPF